MKRDIPLLMVAPMVRATEAGTKTQTRRTIKPQPPVGTQRVIRPNADERLQYAATDPHDMEQGQLLLGEVPACPYGKPGDRIWVKETFFAFGRWETRFDAKKGRDAWHFVDMTPETTRIYRYAADGVDCGKPSRSTATPAWWKRPAIFMPRGASRITLEVTEVRVERLQDISYEDALAEGAPDYRALIEPECTAGETADECARRLQWPQRWYRDLWTDINGDGSWEANPWVWAVSFRPIQSPAPAQEATS